MTRSIRSKMILWIAGPTLAILVLGMSLTIVRLRADARMETQRTMIDRARNYAARFDGAFREVAAIAEATANFMETRPDLTEAQIFKQLRANVSQNDAVYGAAMAFEPGTFKTDDSLFCPYVYRGTDGLTNMHISREVLDWYQDPQWQWWHVPKDNGQPAWTDPYFDEGAGNVLMVTYSVPFERDGRFRGVTTVDVMLPTLQDSIAREILSNIDFIILSGSGRFVYSQDESEIMKRNIFAFAEELARPDLAELGHRIVSGESGVAVVDGIDEQAPDTQWVFYAPITSTGWGFAALLPEREALAGLYSRLRMAVVALAVTLIVIVLLVMIVSGRITRPIERLRSMALEIASGKLDIRVEGIDTRDEIGELARSFNQMTDNLNDLVGNVKGASVQMNSTATEVAATSHEQQATASSFGASASQIAAAVQQISATSTALSQTMDEVNRATAETAELAGAGRASLSDMETMMRSLDEATASIADKLAIINDKTSNITGVITTITKVADQTNLLSVNAAIEAEKAGEYGTGFLVVAREIRRLADQTAAATLDIEHMVQDMDSAVSSGVMEMDRFTDYARRSVQNAAAVAQQMGRIIEQVNNSTERFERINEGMHSQSTGADQIHQAMGQLNDNAKRTMAATQEYAQAAADLRDAIASLRASVASFELRS